MPRPTNPERDEALLTGSRVYEGQECWCGSRARYVKGGACVECAKKNAALNRQKKFSDAPARIPEPLPGDIGPASTELNPWD